MFEEKVYWLWLQNAFGAGSDKTVSIYKRYKNLQEFYEGGRHLWAQYEFINEKELSVLSMFTPAQAEAQIEFCEKVGQTVITYTDEVYPEKLRQIHAPPAVLYAKGDISNFDNSLTISIVGSRGADEKSIKNTEYIAYELAKEGVIIVSGGALGIDAAAHKGALRAGGVTACILACGIGYPYLMSNQILRERIAEKNGCLLTEYPINTGVFKGTFAIRNRIMSGLSNGLLVVRAKEKSGTMLTVAHATKQDKDIFAFPGEIDNPFAKGTNMLIQDGATPVLKADDILEHYSHLYKKTTEKPVDILSKSRKDDDVLSERAKMVYNVLESEPAHVSLLCSKTELKISQVLAAVTELELLGYAKTYSGQRCSLI